MKLNKLITTAAAALAVLSTAHATVHVVASLPELAAIAKEVGGDRVSVISLAKPDQDYHKVEPRPSDVRRVADADLFVRVGMDMDMWADALLNAARNGKIAHGAPGYVDTSDMIRKLEVPSAQISGASGDIHVYGNPHYWTDPGDAKVIAYEILLGLRNVDRAGGNVYNANYQRFVGELTKRMAVWTEELAPFKGRKYVAYHDEWVYFSKRFDLHPFAYLEPKPGIPPSASHVSNLINEMKRSGVHAVIIPSIYPTKFADLLTRDAGAKVERVPYSVGAMGTTDYFSYINAIVNGFKQALS